MRPLLILLMLAGCATRQAPKPVEYPSECSPESPAPSVPARVVFPTVPQEVVIPPAPAPHKPAPVRAAHRSIREKEKLCAVGAAMLLLSAAAALRLAERRKAPKRRTRGKGKR